MVWLCSLSLWLYMLNSRTWQGMLVLPNLSCNLEWHGAQLKPQLKKRYSDPNVACGHVERNKNLLEYLCAGLHWHGHAHRAQQSRLLRSFGEGSEWAS